MEIDDDSRPDPECSELIERMKVVLNNKKMEKWTLRELCLKAVIDNKGVLLKSIPGLIGFQNLPVVLKTDLLKMTKSFEYENVDNRQLGDDLLVEEKRHFVSVLLHQRVKTLYMPDCSKWNMNNKSALKKLLVAIGIRCSGLTTFRLDCWWYRSEDEPSLTKDSWYGRPFFEMLPRLKSLKFVVLQFCDFDDWALQQIGEHGQSLVSLHLGMKFKSKVTHVGIKALSSLPHLRQFTFGAYKGSDITELEKQCLLWCTQYLPHLREAGLLFNTLYDDDHDFCEGYHSEVMQQLEPMKLSLETLTLDGWLRPRENIQLPYLEALHLFGPRSDAVDLCDRFMTLTSLGLIRANDDIITKALRRVGQRLRRLVIDKPRSSLSLVEVLQLCPKLELLRLVKCQFTDSSKKWPKGLFGHLEQVFYQESHPNSCIMQLLCAPLVKKFLIYESYLTNSEVDKLIPLVQQRLILQNAAYIRWQNYRRSPEHDMLTRTIQVTFPNLKLQTEEDD